MPEDASRPPQPETPRRRASDREGSDRVGRRWSDRHPELTTSRPAPIHAAPQTDEEWRERVERLRQRQRRPFGRRGREFLYRFREPLIGVGVAAAAAPLIRAGAPADEATNDISRTRVAAASATTGAAFAGDLEDEVAERWAASEEERAREETVAGAVDRYGIDRALAESIYDAAQTNEIEPEIAFGLVKTESTFDQRAVSHVGARGLTQVMPRTARWLRPGTTAEDLFDKETNLDLGFSYLHDLIDKYKGNVRLALTAYNRGPGTVDRVLKRGGNPENGYADKVLDG